MRKNIFYFSTALSDEIYTGITDKCNSFKPTFSGVGFDRNVGVGLSEYADVTGISLAPIPSWPKYKYIKSEAGEFHIGSFKAVVPALISIPIVKEFCFYSAVKRYLRKNIKKNEDNVVVISGLYRSLLRPARYMKKKYGVKVCAIVPDLPELMMTYRKDYSKLRKVLNNIDANNSKKYRSCVDGYVFLSQYMNEAVNEENKPYAVVDGLCDIAAFPETERDTGKRFILYAGKISEKFGVRKLVEAFIEADIQGLNLVLCGDGDYADALRSIAGEHDNIQFLGTVPHEKVLSLEMEADLLVDPRPSDMEVVKMSFPSKIIEYMASGTPVLTTNLPCFSEDYRKYQYRIEDESVSGIQKTLIHIFSVPEQERAAMGVAAQEFIFENKTLKKQCEEIMKLIDEVCK